MAPREVIFLDTNVLVHAHRSGSDLHLRARQWIEHACRGPNTVGVSVFTVSEFVSVVTHPNVPGGASSPAEARGFIEGITAVDDIRLAQPGPDFARRLIALVDELGIRGPRVFDLQIALTARDHGAREVWTCDKKFVNVDGLSIVNPADTMN